MRVFSRRPHSRPKREDWPRICACITDGLEAVRKEFFDSCVRQLRRVSSESEDFPVDVVVVNDVLGGQADLAIKALQLTHASSFLAKHAYIPRRKGKDFADLLYAHVCGGQIRKILEYQSRYLEVAEDGGTLLFRFSLDVAKYICDEEAPLPQSQIVAIGVRHYLSIGNIVVASCFEDRETVRELKLEGKEV